MQDLEFSTFADIKELRWCWDCGGSFYVRRGDYGKIITCPWCFKKGIEGWPNDNREDPTND